MLRTVRFAAMTIALCSCCSRGADAEVRVVAESGGDFQTLQPAIDASANGDVVLVKRDFIAETAVIDGKAIVLVADPAVDGFHVEKLSLTVKNTPAGSTTILRGIQLANQSGACGVIEIADCLGHVHLEDIVLAGPDGTKTVLVSTAGRPSLVVRNCASVSFHASTFRGGRGFDACMACLEYGIPLPATIGGAGAVLIDSRVSAHDTMFAGGNGGSLLNGSPIASGCGLQMTGGSASFTGTTACAGNGIGDGLVLLGSFAAPIVLQDATLIPGSLGGQALTSPPGATHSVAGTARHFSLDAPLREQQIASATFDGEPGDLVLLALGLGGATLAAPPLTGWIELRVPLLSMTPVAMLVGPNGVASLAAPIPDLPSGVEAVTIQIQPFFLAGSNAFAGPSTAFVLLSASL